MPGARDETVTSIIRIPFVRVLLHDNQPEVALDADGALVIECLTGKEQMVYYSAQEVRIVNSGRRLQLEDVYGKIIQEQIDEITLLPRGSHSRVMLNDKRYRGILKAYPYNEDVRLVNILYMEDYLRGVVPPELGQRTEDEREAIKAQAVAARTYAIQHLGQYEGEPFDMKPTVADQLYQGYEVEAELYDEGIDETAGEVIMFRDEFINAYYHSTCAGTTDEISAVWDKPAMPYLIPVEDSGACSWSKYFVWREDFTEPMLRGHIEAFLSKEQGRDVRLDPITDVVVLSETPGGRVGHLLVRTETDTYHFYEDRIRWVIMRASNPKLILPSDKFEVRIGRSETKEIVEISFLGGGYGHGVGMCQCGAIGMARAGRAYQDILKHYYSGVTIRKLY